MIGRLGQFSKRAYDAVDGLKTLGAAVILFLLGLADYTDVVNISPILENVLGADVSKKVIMLMPIVFGTLRFMTKDKPRWLRRREDEAFDENNQKDCH